MRAKAHTSTRYFLTVILAVVSIAKADEPVSELWARSLAAESDGDYVCALKYHAELLPKVGKSYTAALRMGWLHYMNAEYSLALMNYEKAAGLSPGALAPLYGAMNCQVALGKSAPAVKVAKAILVIDELNYTANKQLASIYYTEKKYSLAAAYYRKLNRLYPEDLAVASGLAWSYLEQGESRSAAPLFRGILMVSPDYVYAQRGLEICNRTARR